MRPIKLLIPYFSILCLIIGCSNEVPTDQTTTPKTVSTTYPILETTDGFSISTQYKVPSVDSGKIPAIVLIHQGTTNKNEWLQAANTLSQAGYATLAIDLRGHGQSTPVDDINALFSDPNQTPLDVLAALEFLRNDESIDDERLAIIGASIGAELACVATSQFNIKTAVAISADIKYVRLLHSEAIKLKSIFHIGAENDIYQSAQELYNISQEPRSLYILDNSATHGASLFYNNAINEQVLEWLKTNL